MVYKEWWGSVAEDSTHAGTAGQNSPGAPVLRGNAHHGKWLHNSPCQTAYSANTNLADFPIQMSHCCLYYIGSQLKPKPCSNKSCNTVNLRSESIEETWCTELVWGLCLTWWFFLFTNFSLQLGETVEIKYEAFRQFSVWIHLSLDLTVGHRVFGAASFPFTSSQMHDFQQHVW